MAQRKGLPYVSSKIPKPRPTTGGTTVRAGLSKARRTGSSPGK